jgi:hypothetical protein
MLIGALGVSFVMYFQPNSCNTQAEREWDGGTFLRQRKKVPPAYMQRVCCDWFSSYVVPYSTVLLQKLFFKCFLLSWRHRGSCHKLCDFWTNLCGSLPHHSSDGGLQRDLKFSFPTHPHWRCLPLSTRRYPSNILGGIVQSHLPG